MYRNRLTALLLGLLWLTVAGVTARAQEVPPLPIDPEVRMGKLPNGLTYFIRHNEQPKERASFYIAQRVGSMQEEDPQAGLAHFLEHMAFNGTRHFPDKMLISYLENKGVRFGSNLNAYTSFDETMYTIMDAPSTDQGVVDSCLLILRDWSDGIALKDKEIDNERGVIEEEWRSRDGADMRMYTELLRRGFPEGSNYSKRMPIGEMEVVRNFTYQELRDYYHKWYRPDLQGIIVVGDIDVDYVEGKIKELFGSIPTPEGAAKRVYEAVPSHAPKSLVITDPEATGTRFMISFSDEARPQEVKSSAVGLMVDYMFGVMTGMLNTRFSEIIQKPNAPFTAAEATYGDYLGVAVTREEFAFHAVAHEGREEEALNALVAEIKRALEYGFTEGEYNRVRTEVLTQYDDLLKEKENRRNNDYANEYGQYFTKGGYIPGIEVEHALINQIAPSLNVEVINNAFKMLLKDGSLFIYMMGQQKEGEAAPLTDEGLMELYNKAMQQKVEPYVDEVSDEELIPEEQLPTPGMVLSEETDLAFGATLWTLSNGAKVYLLPTEHKKNDIRLYGISAGGMALHAGESAINLRALGLANVGGVAKFDPIALGKVLTGRTAGASTSIGRYTESVSGSSSDRDIETMLQLVYLHFTDVRKDDAAFQAAIERQKSALKASFSNPLSTVVRDSIPHLFAPDDILEHPLKLEEYDQIDYDKLLAIHKARFADASDFTFFLVGSFKPEEVQPLVERYIGGLPALHSNEPYSPEALPKTMATQSRTTHFNVKMDNPMALVVDLLVSEGERSLKSELTMIFLTEILTQHYHETIREQEGGTYGVQVEGNIERHPEGRTQLAVIFQTNPESAIRLNDKVKSELEKKVAEGLDEEYFNKVRLNLEKQYEERLHENSYWLAQLTAKYFFNEDWHTTYLDTLRSITIEDVHSYLRNLKSSNIYLELIATGVTE